MDVSPITVDSFQFPASENTLFLAGAGERGLEIQGKFIRFTAIGVYLEEKAPQLLSAKWKRMSSDELNDSVEFVRDVITAPVEKLTRITFITPLTGKQYSEKVAENCVAAWKSVGVFSDEAEKAVEKFLTVFKDENFPPGSSIVFTHLTNGSLAISFGKHDSMAEGPVAVIENNLLADSILESIIGKNGVSPAARLSLCTRMSELLNKSFRAYEDNVMNSEDSINAPTVSAMPEITVETLTFPALAKPPAASSSLLLIGGGVRAAEIEGQLIKFTAIGVYLEEKAVTSLALNWKGKTIAELNDSTQFFRDIVTGPFEKFTRVTMIMPLTGQQYSEKVSENCVAIWKSLGLYTDAEANAVEQFLSVFKNEKFPPGSSILFTHLPHGSLAISFSKHDDLPDKVTTVIENKLLSEAILESIIGKHGVSPATRYSVAQRLCGLLVENHSNGY